MLRELWTEDEVDFGGEFCRTQRVTLAPKPFTVTGRRHPDLFLGGNSPAALRTSGRYADWHLSNGKDFGGVVEQLDELRCVARAHHREVKFALNGFVIARDTEAEAGDCLREIVAKANMPAVEKAFSTPGEPHRMWRGSTFDELVQYNDGFRTQLIGTPEQIAERIVEYRVRGVDLMLCGFLHFQEEIEYFGQRVLPLVRELEAQARTGAPH